MATTIAKERACTKHDDYLSLIYWFGRGVMFTRHVQLYMSHLAGVKNTKVRHEK